MSVIYFNVPGSPGGGGPSVFVYKTAQALKKRGHIVRYEKANRANVALCIIETGKTLKQINRNKTKVVLRIDGIYAKEYWHGGPGRAWRKDMTALHNKLKSDVPSVDYMIYQSQWSKDRLDDEIVKRNGPWSIIHNGVDVNLFKPTPRVSDGFINLFHIGKIRNGYIMESLIGTFNELKKRGHKVKLVIAGGMDAECGKVYSAHKSDPNIVHLGAFPNTTAVKAFGQGDIFLGPRMGSSCDNVIVEALACGLAILIPAWGGNSELINDGKEGIIVDSGGHWNYGLDYIQKFADGVEKIIPDLDGFKLRAREHAVKELTIDKMVDRYLKAMGI